MENQNITKQDLLDALEPLATKKDLIKAIADSQEELAGMIQRSFIKVDERFDKIEIRLDKIEARLDSIDIKLDSVVYRKEFEALRKEFAAFLEKVKSLENRVLAAN